MRRDVNGRVSRTYTAWLNMKTRCNNPNFKGWERYGGRGIGYDRRWESFDTFQEDLGECPDGLTLERKDNNKDYSKENCEWATKTKQSLHRDYVRLPDKADSIRESYSRGGITQAELARQHGVSREAISAVITGRNCAPSS